MNPFTLPGPQFLGVYLFLGTIAIVLVLLRRLAGGGGSESGRAMADLTADPYRIGFVRGGAAEAIRLAIFNLVDRRVLKFQNGRVVGGHKADTALLRRPLDRAIVKACVRPATVAQLLAERDVVAEANQYRPVLAAQGLVAGGDELASRKLFGFALAAVLVGIAVAKIGYALSQGRSNVVFLAIEAAVIAGIVVKLSVAHRTRYGGAALRNLRTLMKRAKAAAIMLKSGGATNEALLLAAVHGIGVLPERVFGDAHAMFPQRSKGDSGGSSDSSSSCSSDSSCGGGGGCGGCGS